MAKARKASVTQSKLGMILYGEQFTGKSTMAMQLAYFKRPDGKPFRVLYLDPETGSIDDYLGELEANGVDLENIYIVYTQSLGEVREYIAKVKNNEDLYVLDEETGDETDEVLLDADGEPFRADAIVVDGTSILNLTTKQGLIEFSKKRNKVKADKDGLVGDARLVKIEGAGMELKDYQTINFKGQDLILDLMASGVHYIVTARETDEKETIKQADGSTMSVTTGRKIPDGFKGMTYNVKTEVRMFRNEDGVVCAHVKKDRTHTHEDNIIIEDPTLVDWQAVIDKTADKKAFVVKNDLTKAVDVEQNIYSKEILGKVGEPANEESEEDHNSGVDIEAMKKEIIAKKNALSPVDKKEMGDKLKAAGLPTAFKNVTDVTVLQKVLDMFQ
ncbi:ATP-binding protein [Acetatifactor muris]|uniref:AAA domain-containing protein n=1 Tax=Acetatifactor muris TaxID=879566 RepID=A0A2K4ZM09_9FIRM|nr:ATP-binding protein [Acetatifactor muris]MCR2049740.1 ATP-binding protein [Acetatifactor muris]SOY31456.1 hypothetical protein AMURIS_04199 [Acetatifactor muris]